MKDKPEKGKFVTLLARAGVPLEVAQHFGIPVSGR